MIAISKTVSFQRENNPQSIRVNIIVLMPLLKIHITQNTILHCLIQNTLMCRQQLEMNVLILLEKVTCQLMIKLVRSGMGHGSEAG